MKSKVKMIKSRRLKSRKYKKKTLVRVRLGKNIHRGGADSTFHIDITDDGKYLYITDTKQNYLYKIDVEKENYQINKTEGDAYPLNLLNEIIRNKIFELFELPHRNNRIVLSLKTLKNYFDALPRYTVPRARSVRTSPIVEGKTETVAAAEAAEAVEATKSKAKAVAEAVVEAVKAKAKAVADAAAAAEAAAEAAKAKTEELHSPRTSSPRTSSTRTTFSRNTNHSPLETRLTLPHRTPSPKSFLTRVREGLQRFTRKITRRTLN